jgi:hypothetical protein
LPVSVDQAHQRNGHTEYFRSESGHAVEARLGRRIENAKPAQGFKSGSFIR